MRRHPVKFECRYAATSTNKHRIAKNVQQMALPNERHIDGTRIRLLLFHSSTTEQCIPLWHYETLGTIDMHSLCKTYTKKYIDTHRIHTHTTKLWHFIYPPFRLIIQYTCTWYNITYWHANVKCSNSYIHQDDMKSWDFSMRFHQLSIS